MGLTNLFICVVLLCFHISRGNDIGRYFQELNSCVTYVERTLQSREHNSLEHCHRMLEEHVRLLSRIFDHLRHTLTPQEDWITNMISELHNSLRNMFFEVDQILNPPSPHSMFQIAVHRTGGRPRYDLNRGQLSQLRESGMCWTAIAACLGVSCRTIRRRRLQYGMEEQFDPISDHHLDALIRSIITQTPNAGVTLVLGSLQSRGLLIQRRRVRERLAAVDPVGTLIRTRHAIRRRVYNVRGPNHLWHIDSNHKLIAWRFVFHGCIDGYSRTVIYLECCTNNRATSVLAFFQHGVARFGMPQRVRGDRGGVNVDVARYMINNQGSGRGSFIVGRSVHNQRIERLWADVNRVVSDFYKQLFQHMEETGILDSTHEVHLWALHFVFLSRIQQSAREFVQQWNHHHLTSAQSMTPLALWYTGMLSQPNVILVAQDIDDYSIDYDGPIIENGYENAQVNVPESNLTLNPENVTHLQTQCNPLSDDGNYGIDHYFFVLDFISRLL